MRRRVIDAGYDDVPMMVSGDNNNNNNNNKGCQKHFYIILCRTRFRGNGKISR